MRSTAALITVALLLSGCGPASAAALGPADDAHCSVLAYYFSGLARHGNAPRAQQHAVEVINRWYAAKARAQAARRWGGLAGLEAEMGPVLERIKADPAAVTGAMAACTARATADPGFDRFMRS